MTEPKNRLGSDVYIALAAIGWADGTLDQNEADAIVRTALEDGLDLHEITDIEDATKNPVSVGDINWRKMTKVDRLFVYAVAEWISRIDGKVTDAETEALENLGKALHIPSRPREHAASIAQEIAEMPEGDRPDRYDLPLLRRVIKQRLEAAQEARAALKEMEEGDLPELEADGSTLVAEEALAAEAQDERTET